MWSTNAKFKVVQNSQYLMTAPASHILVHLYSELVSRDQDRVTSHPLNCEIVATRKPRLHHHIPITSLAWFKAYIRGHHSHLKNLDQPLTFCRDLCNDSYHPQVSRYRITIWNVCNILQTSLEEDLDLGEYACDRVDISFSVISASSKPGPDIDVLFDPSMDPEATLLGPDQVYSPAQTGICVHGGKDHLTETSAPQNKKFG